MPFKSEKQRRFLWAEHPEIARKWADKYPQKEKLPLYAKRKKKANTVTVNEQNSVYVKNCTILPVKKTGDNVNENSKNAADKLVAVELPECDKPTYAGQNTCDESVDISEHENEVGNVEKPKTPEKNEKSVTDEMDETAADILKKFSAVISPVLRQKIEDNVAALEHRPPAPVRENPTIKEYAPDEKDLTADNEKLNPALTTGEQAANTVQQPAKPQDPNGPVGGGSHPQANVIKSFGPLAANGNLNGNAAFGAKNSPNSSKTSSVFSALTEKLAMKLRAANCMCTGVKAYECSCKKSCVCKQPGMSCAKYVHPEKETPAVKKTAELQDILTKWAFLVGASGGKSTMKKPKALRIKKPKKTYMKRSVEKQAGKSPAWQRSEGQNSEGGLNAKGRASYNKATGGNLKAPVTQKNPTGKAKSRRASFCARMGGMKKKLTGAETKNDPDSRINKALRKWNC